MPSWIKFELRCLYSKSDLDVFHQQHKCYGRFVEIILFDEGKQLAIDLIVSNGKLVIPKRGIVEADIGIQGEKIVKIASPGTLSAPSVIDAEGKHIFPGCVEPHYHYGHFNEFYSEVESESKNAALTGITTSVILLDRNISNMDGWNERIDDPSLFTKIEGRGDSIFTASYKLLFPEVIKNTEKKSSNDFAFHLLMENLNQIEEIPFYYRELGISSFKFWTGSPPAGLTKDEIWVLLRKCKELGVLPYAQCRNREIGERAALEAGINDMNYEEILDPETVRDASPSFAETLDLQTVLYLAHITQSPELLIAHVTYRDSVKLIHHYRHELGLNVQGETCAGWLSLWWPEVGERLGHIATGVTPQLGFKEDADLLWDGIRTGDISCIGTDGMVPPRKKLPNGKPNRWYRPPPTREKPGLGFPQHDCMFPVVLHMALERGLSPVQIAEVCAYNPAKLLQLHPRKGDIAVESDADLIFMDLDTQHTVKNSELYSAASFTPWEGWKLNCWPTMTMIRGQVIFEQGKQVTECTGRYQPRYPSS